MRVPPIRTQRLDLVSMSPPLIEALLAGDDEAAGAILGADPHPQLSKLAHGVMVRRQFQMSVDPSEQEWLVRAFILREPQPQVVGFGGFHSRPDARGRAELGYQVFAEHRRRGYAREAAIGLMDWATTVHGVRRFICSISPTNAASLELARGLGFVQTGTQWDDEDGLELVLELALPGAPD